MDNGNYVLQIVNVDESGYKTIAQANITVLHNGYEIINNIKIIPNPMDTNKNDVMTFRYSVMAGTKVTIKIYNMAGELVKTLYDLNATGEIKWDISAENTAYVSGVYVCIVDAQASNGINKRRIEKFVLIR